MRKILITGAAGNLGSILRPALKGWADAIRLSDLADLGTASDGEEIVPCDLGDFDAVMDLVKNMDGIIHLGGQSQESTFERILNDNIKGTYNIYEAARRQGVPRILFASSNHTIGFHKRTDTLDVTAAPRPDSLYGVSKCFGENLAQLYYDKFGVESVSVRIGACFHAPKDARMLHIWLSPDDFVDLVKKSFEAPKVGAAILYGVSDNKDVWWNNDHADFLGWKPKDSSEKFREEIEAMGNTPDPNDIGEIVQGGWFASAGHYEDS